MILALTMALSLAAPLRAGFYMPGEPPDLIIEGGTVQPLPFSAFQLTLRNILDINMPGSEPNLKYTQERDQLLAKGASHLTVDEMVRLSAIWMRFRNVDKAFAELNTARQRDPRNFLVQSNLSLVEFIRGEPTALSDQAATLSMRPSELPGLSKDQVAWFLKVERRFLDLQKLRRAEQRANGPRAPVEKWDDLFHVAFTGPSGEYEAGTIADDQKQQLPADAIATVQQLLIWLPDDARVYWLLAELYNATGNLPAAAAIFDDCLNARRFQPELLKAHRRVVQEALTAKAAANAPQPGKSWKDHPEVFWIAGGVVAVPLALLAYWQIREIARRLRGVRPKQT
ncbi:MAG: tetratricopeptide repeat protein [Gemmataceae bacterium]